MSRAVIEGPRETRAAPVRVMVRRFGWWTRATHAVLALSVFGLVFTGMPLKYADTAWATLLIRVWGSAYRAGFFHRAFAIAFFFAGGMHVGGLVAAAVRRRFPAVTGPDSIVLGPRDLRHIGQYLGYLRGKGPRPDFGRYTYWEKFDYFAEIWGLLVIGLTGLMMWFPELAARFLPGWIVNAALIFHSYEALLAAAFLFAIHFFNTHLRPDTFPVDRVMFSGRLPLDEVRERYPGWYRRIVDGGGGDLEVAPERSHLAAAIVSVVFLTLGIAMLLLVMSAAVAEAGRYLLDLLG